MEILLKIDKKFTLIFLGIIILAAFLRFYRLSDIPPGVNRDEASIGYTAYSLLQTGKDEYGRPFPISFQSFGDWKLPLYMYMTVVTVKSFGLSEIAVRISSSIVGVATVVLVYFLVMEFFNKKSLSLLTMFLIAVSPWHLHLSRVESESNTAVFLIVLGIILFSKSLQKTHWFIIPSFLFIVLTYFTYAGNYIFTTLLLVGILLFYKKQIPKTKYTIVAFALLFLTGIFIGFQTFRANTTKASGIGIFGDPAIVHAKIEIPRNEHNNPQALIARFLHNRLIFAAERIFQNYLMAFSPEFLFIKGGANKAHNIDNFGNMYLVEAPFLFFGIISLIFFLKGREKKLVLWWFLVAPIAASITKDAPHSNRMFAIFPILPLVTALGILWVFDQFAKSKFQRKLLIVVILLLFFINISIYLDRYYIHFSKNEGQNWGFVYKSLSDFISQSKFKSKEIIMANPEYSPYIFLLFYQQYDPKKYQEEASRYTSTEDGFIHVKSFDRYKFREIDWRKDTQLGNRLLIDFSDNVPISIKKDFQTFDSGIFTVVETK